MNVLVINKDRDLLLTEADFERIRKLIRQCAGISLAAHKTEMVYSRLAKRLRLLGKQRFKDYLAMLEADADHPEWEHFTNALTTNLTSFFREAHHFPLLAAHAKAQAAPLRVWSCAASTGEEPYSIAITLAEAMGSQARSARILATDIDTRALAVADAGIYPVGHIGKLSPERLKRFFQKGSGSRAGMARIHGSLREMIDFQALNLLSPRWDTGGPFDAIFCRNLMIYFDKPTQRQILERFVGLLKPNGLLFAGHSENFTYITPAFRLRGHTVYEVAAAMDQAV